jgi:Ca2+/Na+ antiporter
VWRPFRRAAEHEAAESRGLLTDDTAVAKIEALTRLVRAAESGESRPTRTLALGALPAITVVVACGLAICAWGDAMTRSTRSSSQYPFWVGLLVIFVPIVWRLVSGRASRVESVGLVALLGLALYLVKVLQSPFSVTYADEFIHLYNAREIVATHHLYQQNSLLPVTPRYPGLEALTAALSSTTGIGIFRAGLIVIGAARVVLMLSLFALFERMTNSYHVAALGTAVYTANSNFLFFSAQFSYESLALPLLVVTFMFVVERESVPKEQRKLWALPIVLLISAVVVTHHLTSYALTIILLILGAVLFFLRRRTGSSGPWPYALFALVAVVVWLIVVGSAVVGYLSPVLTTAFRSTLKTLSGESKARRLFSSAGSAGYRVSLLERVVGLGSYALLALAYPLGLLVVWRRFRTNAVVVVLTIGSLGFFAVAALRFSPAAWETANRSSEFLYIGLALVIGLIAMNNFVHGQHATLVRTLSVLVLAIVFCGGVIAGWRPEARVSRPYEVSARSQTIKPEGAALAQWVAEHFPPETSFAASDSDGRFLLLDARARAIVGRNPDVVDILKTETLAPWQLELLRKQHIRYVVVDLRSVSFDNILGYYFDVPGTGEDDSRLSAKVASKFDAIHVDRIYDGGDIIVYDLGPKYGLAPKH